MRRLADWVMLVLVITTAVGSALAWYVTNQRLEQVEARYQETAQHALEQQATIVRLLSKLATVTGADPTSSVAATSSGGSGGGH